MHESANLWNLVLGRPEVDPGDLARAIESEAPQEGLDFRTRLLIRDGVEALRGFWGEERLARWLEESPARNAIRTILGESFASPGFASLGERIKVKTDPADIDRFLRELGTRIAKPTRILIGGSVSLILTGHLDRHTEDIDLVDEVPSEIRSLHEELARLRARYGLALTHFQSHYLPEGWQQRIHSRGPHGRIEVFLVDPADVFLSKLFSNRPKDRDDLRLLLRTLDLEVLRDRLRSSCRSLLQDDRLRRQAEENWYILQGEDLPE